MIKALAAAAPDWAKRLVPQSVKDKIVGGVRVDIAKMPSLPYLQRLMLRYQTENLINVTTQAFRARIDEFLNLEDAAMEGFKDPTKQRDRSIKFHWGHDHDFGDFQLKGAMGYSYLAHLANFIDWFPVLPQSLEGCRVLDIGCWSGGTSLLMCAMGATVVAVEEVKKYIDCLEYLKYAFDLKQLEPRNLSLYECVGTGFDDSFDYILFAGVLYHVTDPVLALRICYNALKDGGKLALETACSQASDQSLIYEGPGITFDGTVAKLSRSGWNWFRPSPSTLLQMIADVGFMNGAISPVIMSGAGPRILATGQRIGHIDIMRGGLSVRNMR